jgi:hypothetical protein
MLAPEATDADYWDQLERACPSRELAPEESLDDDDERVAPV